MSSLSDIELALTNAGVGPSEFTAVKANLALISSVLRPHLEVVLRLAAKGQCVPLLRQFLHGQGPDSWAGSEQW